MADRVGQQLGNYQLVSLLGQGGFADVYLGEHVYLKTRAAIKVLQAQLAKDDMEGFLTEARTIAKLVHPNIVRVLDFGLQGNTPFLVMDFAPNGSLRQLHPKGKVLHLATITSYVKQVAAALQYAHNEKLVHRDIKPENMLVGRQNEILLGDFGIALIAQSSRYQSKQDIAGTVAYMSPEQIQGKPRPASDQYSLGVVVYEWLSGNRPFYGSFTELCTQHMFAPPPSLRGKVPTISPEIEQVVMTALAKDPKERFMSVQAFANALEQAGKSAQVPLVEARPDRLPTLSPSTQPGPVMSPPAPAFDPGKEIFTRPEQNIPPPVVASPWPTPIPPIEKAAPSYSRPTAIPRPTPLPAIASPKQEGYAPRSSDTPPLAPQPTLKSRRFLAVSSIGFVLVLVLSVGGFLVVPLFKGPQTSPSAMTTPDKQIAILPQTAVSDIATFDPGLSTDLTSIQAIDLVFTGLVQLDDNLRVQPQLAASYSVASDGVTWTFHLRPNLKFSDGMPLTSADVAYSIDRALQPAEKSTVGPIYLALIKDSDKLMAGKIKTIIGDSIMTPDPSTVLIVANKKATYFLDALTYSCSYVVQKSLIDKYGNTQWTDHLTEGGGDGPFKVASYTHGQNIIFVPNPNYYGPIPQLKKVVYPIYKDLDTAYKAYQMGQVDTATIPAAQLASARQLTQEFHQVPQLWINYYAMNYLVKPFDNIKIRQAFELAIDKDLIVHSVWKDKYIATNHIVPKGMPGYTPNLTEPDGVTGTSGNPTLAKQLFQQGLQEEGMTLATLPPIRLTYSSGSTETDNEVAALQQMWQNVLGVSVKADQIDFNRLLSEIMAATNNHNGLQFWGIGWIADYPDPQDFTTLQFDKGVPNNNMNYGQNNSSDSAQQQAVQQQLEQADVAPAGGARLQSYMQAEQQLVNDVAWLPMEQVTLNLLQKPCVAGLVYNASGLTPPNDWGTVYISTATQCADTSSYQ